MDRAINRWLIVTALLTVIFGVLLWNNRSATGNAEYYEGSNTVNLCEYIEFNMLKTDIELIPYSGDRIKFEYKSIVPITVLTGDNRLVINESDEIKVSFMTDERSDFVFRLYLPRHMYRSIIVYSTSASVMLDGVRCEAVSVITKSGDISSVNTNSKVQLTSGSGDIFLDFAQVLPDCSVITRNGDAEIRFPEGSSVALSYETDTGSFRSELLTADIKGSYMYSFSGGENLILAEVERGMLTVSEKMKEGQP